ncbi:MAG: hypothetical protein AAF702_43430 [Chloroflexota bacterium]
MCGFNVGSCPTTIQAYLKQNFDKVSEKSIVMKHEDRDIHHKVKWQAKEHEQSGCKALWVTNLRYIIHLGTLLLFTKEFYRHSTIFAQQTGKLDILGKLYQQNTIDSSAFCTNYRGYM